MNLTSVYNNPDFSDLTIVLRDDREIKVHKNILCACNEWFKKACDIGSRFAEVGQTRVELKHDDPDVIDGVIRHTYKVTTPQRNDSSWLYWLNVWITADKYLEPGLVSKADERFLFHVFLLQNSDTVLEVIDAISGDFALVNEYTKLAGGLCRIRLSKLLENNRFRQKIDSDYDLRWMVIKHLNNSIKKNNPKTCALSTSRKSRRKGG